MIARRAFLASGLAVGAASAFAQTRAPVPRIAVLDWGPESGADHLEAFKKGLRDDGLIDGRTVVVSYRFAGENIARVNELAAEIVRTGADIIVAITTPAAHAAKRATSTIPIVFISGDAVGTGLVSNLARPDGNLTGVSVMLADLEARRLELLRQAMPGLQRVTYIGSSVDPATAGFVRNVEDASARMGVTLSVIKVEGPGQIDGALAEAARNGAQAVILQTLFTLSKAAARQAAAQALAHRMPAIGSNPDFGRSGGLMSFGPLNSFSRQRAAALVARILAGAKPGDLAVEQPTKFQMIINQKTARTLGIEIPVLVLAQADEVIE